MVLGNLNVDRVISNENVANGVFAVVDGSVVISGTQASYNQAGLNVGFSYSGIYLVASGDVEIHNTEAISNNGTGRVHLFHPAASFRGAAAARRRAPNAAAASPSRSPT